MRSYVRNDVVLRVVETGKEEIYESLLLVDNFADIFNERNTCVNYLISILDGKASPPPVIAGIIEWDCGCRERILFNFN